MQFEWDYAKAVSNRAKHGVSFELAGMVWDDPLHVVGVVVVLVVVHSHPDDDDERIRIIGVRKATSHERKRYEQESP